jgi:hypothetical protein
VLVSWRSDRASYPDRTSPFPQNCPCGISNVAGGSALTKQDQSVKLDRTAFGTTARIFSVLFFGAFAVLFTGFAVFGSQSPGAAAVLAAGSAVYAYDLQRRGLFVEADGVRIVQPWRRHPLRFAWHDIAGFEMQTRPGQWPVVLISNSDQRRIPVPTFSKPRKDLDTPERYGMRKKVQAQIDELNRLLEQHSGVPVKVSDKSF